MRSFQTFLKLLFTVAWPGRKYPWVFESGGSKILMGLTTGHSSFLEQLPSTGTPKVPPHSTARRPRNWKNREPYLKAETKMLSHTTAWLQVRATPWCLISSRRSEHWKRASVSSLSSPEPLSFNSVCLLEYFLTITDWTMGLCWSVSHPK